MARLDLLGGRGVVACDYFTNIQPSVGRQGPQISVLEKYLRNDLRQE